MTHVRSNLKISGTPPFTKLWDIWKPDPSLTRKTLIYWLIGNWYQKLCLARLFGMKNVAGFCHIPSSWYHPTHPPSELSNCFGGFGLYHQEMFSSNRWLNNPILRTWTCFHLRHLVARHWPALAAHLPCTATMPCHGPWLLQDNSGNMGSMGVEFSGIWVNYKDPICSAYIICTWTTKIVGVPQQEKRTTQAWFRTGSGAAQAARGHSDGGLPHHCNPLPRRSPLPQTSKKNLNKLRLELSSNLDVSGCCCMSVLYQPCLWTAWKF